MSLKHVDPPPGSYGFEVEKAAINILMSKKDKGGFLFLTTESLIYHGKSLSFFLQLCHITNNEASAGLFESPFIKLTFNIPDEDRTGTAKFNIKSRAFDKFVTAFPVVYAKACDRAANPPMQPPPQQPRGPQTPQESSEEECQVPPYPNVVPPYPNVIPPYPNVVSNEAASRRQNASMRTNRSPQIQAITPITAPTPIMEEAERHPLLGASTIKPSPISNSYAAEDRRVSGRAVGGANSAPWAQGVQDRVYNPAMDAKKQQPESETPAYVSGFPVAPPTFR